MTHCCPADPAHPLLPKMIIQHSPCNLPQQPRACTGEKKTQAKFKKEHRGQHLPPIKQAQCSHFSVLIDFDLPGIAVIRYETPTITAKSKRNCEQVGMSSYTTSTPMDALYLHWRNVHGPQSSPVSLSMVQRSAPSRSSHAGSRLNASGALVRRVYKTCLEFYRDNLERDKFPVPKQQLHRDQKEISRT